MTRKILITTTTRADWGILSPLARALAARPDVEVRVMASNMHLDPLRGNTLGEIEADGFTPLIAPMPTGYVLAADAAKAMADGARSAATVIGEEAPDAMVMLGDRFEMLAMATVAAVMRVPVIHLCGGEVSEGAMDDCFRHAITKLSALHLVTTENHRRRVIQLGEEPERVINVGSLAAAIAAKAPDMSRGELEADLGWSFGQNGALLLTLHPETL
ncbi:MAG: UDP-N-acetylglucosamine 2-epimerase, partial [Muribaculaceae bacterium]|nr:UDP-N-acetylglucosamine 2-epimerase [Muribaculaceae bacterium]